MEGRYSTRSPAVKRLMREAQELCEPTDQYFAQPLEDNLFEWHFTVRGPLDSDFQAGVYHGRIILPVDYPMKPPSIIWLTPNGRFETNKKICLSISGHHPESWQPSWSIRTALLAIIGFMPTHPGGAIGSLDYKPEERKALAKKSRDWKCPVCGDVSEILLEPNPESSQTAQEAKELATQISFQGEKPKCPEHKNTEEASVSNSSPCTVTAAVSDAEGMSNNAYNCAPSSTPHNALLRPEALTQNPGTFSPWTCPPFIPSSNSAVPPPFLHYPWASHVPAQGGQVGGITSQIPRFPYPPSHYTCRGNTQFYPSGFALPPGVGMFPCPFPPPPSTFFGHNLTSPNLRPPVSVSNSSASSPNTSPDRGSHSHSPNTPLIPNIPPPSPASSSLPGSSFSSPVKEQVLNELLSKVKHLDSDEQTQPSDDAAAAVVAHEHDEAIRAENVIEPVSTALSDAPKLDKLCTEIGDVSSPSELEPVSSALDRVLGSQDLSAKTLETFVQGSGVGSEPYISQVADEPTISKALSSALGVEEGAIGGNDGGAVEMQQNAGSARVIGDHYCVEDSIDKSQITETDISISFMKKESLNESTGMEISHSELSVDAEELGESGPVAFEMSDNEQRSNFERSTSSSMPDLKKRLNKGAVKGLRQRQSAFARVPADVTGDEQTSSEQVTSGGGRQRIEAVSGDSTSVNQQQLDHNVDARHNRDREIHHAHRRARGRQGHSTYDVSFMVMVGLCMTTVFIILNRLFYMVYFSDVFY